MFDSVALDVVVGLVFIYLLYSLLATVISEIIATMLGLRARNLKEAIDRMLNDEKKSRWYNRLWDSLKLMKNPKNEVVNAFYNHPEIKYLGSSGLFKTPSSFKASSFSKTLISLLSGNGPVSNAVLDKRLKEITAAVKSPKGESSDLIKLDPETSDYIRGLWQEAQGDVTRFRALLEGWFDRTMEQTTEWYKRKIQIVLLVLGFCMAWFFYADTFVIVKNLSTDKDARDKMVSMANAYVQNNLTGGFNIASQDSLEFIYSRQKLDSLLVIKKQLDADIARANNIIGAGGWPPDTVKVTTDLKTGEKFYAPVIDRASLSRDDKKTGSGKIGFSFWEKLAYFFRLLYHHFFGFLITAIAISLGAPFWFDLINKIVKLRTSRKEEPGDTNATPAKPKAKGENTNPVTGAENAG